MTDIPDPVLVTGGAGFIGAALIAALRARSAAVTVADRLDWSEATRLHRFSGDEGVRYHRMGMDDPDQLATLLDGPTVVYHLAANTENRGDRTARLADLQGTVAGTVNLLEALALGRSPTIRTVLLTSSQLVYSPMAASASGRITEHDGLLAPASRFGAGKMAAEGFLSAYASELGLTAVACRLSNVIGPGMRRGIVYDLVQRLETEPHRIRLLGDGRQTRSYLHVEDCVSALISLAELGTGAYEVFNVCNTDGISAAQVAAIVAQEFPLGTPQVETAGGEHGWQGDVPTLAVWPQRLLERDWKPALGSADAVRSVARELLAERYAAAADGR